MRLASSAAPPTFVHASCNMVARVHETCRRSQQLVLSLVHSTFMKVWEHVKQEIERRGHKKAAAWLGQHCGYSQQQMTNWAGKRDVPAKEYVNVAAALGTTVEWVASASGRAPTDADRLGVPELAMSPEESDILAVVQLLRPELREILLAFNDLLPEDQQELGRPILERAAQMRKYLDAALSRQGVTHKPGNVRGNDLPVAPRLDGHERRMVNVHHEPERRNSLLDQATGSVVKRGGRAR